MQYVRDTRGVEVLHTPEWLLKQRAGDCDDKSVLLASLLEAIGFQTRFVAVGPAPGIFAHVYVEVRIGNEWVPAETTEPVPMGWEPPNVAARMYG